MRIFEKIKKMVQNPYVILERFIRKVPAIGHILSDETCLKIFYRSATGRRLNLDNPQTLNEKIQWLKLNDRKPEYAMLSDKYEVKKYIADKIGEKYVIPTLGVWDKFEDIDFDKLPNQFVLKCTHDSGSIVICKDKDQFDIQDAKRKLNKCLKTNYYWFGREWQYKIIKPRIIAEQYMEDEAGRKVPEDYKVYCFDGKPKYIVVFHGRFGDENHYSETVYNTDGVPQHITLDNHFSISDIIEPKPECLDELLKISGILSKGFPQIRIDFYILRNEIYFGEITLTTANGMAGMTPPELDQILGKEVHLENLLRI